MNRRELIQGAAALAIAPLAVTGAAAQTLAALDDGI